MMFTDWDSDSSNGTPGISVSTLDAIYIATLSQENSVEGSEEGLVRTEDLIESGKLLKEKSITEKLQEIFNLPNREELRGGTLVIISFG
jgi:hypothetical protein